MNGRFGRPDRRSGNTDKPTQQPGLPAKEARLLDVRQEEGAVHLALDDGSTLEVAPESLPPGMPAVGEMLRGDLLIELRLADERKQVARLIFALLDRRLQPLARIRDKMEEKGYSGAAVDAVLEQMQAKGLYSDRRFAEAYCRDTLISRAVGRRYLEAKLREKKVPGDIAAAVASEVLDEISERELAERAAAARWKKMRGAADLKAVAKVVRHLQGRGFGPGTANEAARNTRPDTRDTFED